MTIQPNDYVKTVSNRFKQEWRGKVRRMNWTQCLIEWSYCGGLPTDICTWVDITEIKRTYRRKTVCDDYAVYPVPHNYHPRCNSCNKEV